MKIDRIPARPRASLAPGIAAVCAAALVSGCMAGPTYGTGKSANAQLLEDLTGVISTESIIGKQRRTAEIAYTPRAEIVRPASLEVLPEPQQAAVSSNNPAWPESPEQRRARIRAEATANRDDINFRPAVDGSGLARAAPSAPEFRHPVAGPASLRGSDRIQQAQKRQGDPTQRRFLSEPPVDYRVPSDNAPTGELGEDEWMKERSLKRAGGKSSWRDLVPWL